MFMVPASNPSIKRTLRPLYAQHQATTWAGFISPTWNKAFDILPGCVMTRLTGEVFAPYTGQAGAKPFGLSAFFYAPNMGVDEISGVGQNLFTVWVGNDDSEFEVLAPAFDVTADWTVPTDGSIKLLTGNAQAKLTPAGATAYNAIAELVSASAEKIVIRFYRPIPGVAD